MKKKTFILFLCGFILFGLTGCGESEESGIKDTLWNNTDDSYSIKMNADGTCALLYDGKETNGVGYYEKSFHTKMHSGPLKCTVEYNKNNTGKTVITMCGSDGKDCISSDFYYDTYDFFYFNDRTWHKQ